ncbi:G-type lectin S-receptor-like serine/threonine-protein kinase At4g27290 [Henckelia pumila]|uniref:G-type lectin S-receptor-like serine/threonine-protein kinase At4g27290 n=1 Tax=Henckelia pumila TaxID=405737 RepID=UPI003C6E74AD
MPRQLCAFLLQLLMVFAIQAAVATDTLSPNQNLSDGQTLISANNIFELGFFHLGHPRNTYLGIWYFRIPLTVVWVANRNKPIRDSSGHLSMTDSGVLLLFNSSMDIVWSTNGTVAPKNRPVLQILDSGNLVVRNQEDDKNDYAWQSFDYISDTLLPGMRLGWNLRTQTNMFMRSWRSGEDPSDGDHIYNLGPPELPQLTLSNGSNKEYRWGPFDGYKFSGGSELRPNTVFKPMYVAGSDGIYFTYELLDEKTLSRLVLTQSGNVPFFTWRNHSREWVIRVIVNRYYCDRYAMCGTYGSCYADDPFCRCLRGFTPRSPQDWQLIDWSGGCGRKYELNCRDGDGFVKYDQLKFPDNAVVWESTVEKCGEECLKKCDCMAYATANVYGNGSRCLVWLTDLVDLRNLPVGGEEIYIRMARAELESLAAAKRKRRVIRCVIVITSSVLAIILVVLVLCYLWQLNRQTGETRTNNIEEDQELHLFPFKCILAATNNFSLHNKIGQGGFGPVYKGELPGAQEIAVKRLSQDSGQGLREFKNEVILIAKLQHRNLVRILGCCIHGDEKMLVYEYLPNKSLDSFIFDPEKNKLLPWSKRFSIILGIARGLLYLHQDSRLRIIHRDMKTSNILLDNDMNPKISDFGLARIFGGEQTEEKTKRVIGTYGYMSPEYAMSGHFSVKSDVFSYGVIVLETITGTKNWGFYHPDHDYNLIGHTWKLWNDKNYCELVDIETVYPEDSVSAERCIQVALLCVQQRHEDRPTISSVVSMLNNPSAAVPQPKQPGFFVEISQNKPDFGSGSGSVSYSKNDMTITVEDGR